MNIGFEEKHLESVATHLNDTKIRETSHLDSQHATKENEKTEKETVNPAVVLQISKNEDGTSGTDKLRTNQVEDVDEKKSQHKTEEANIQKSSLDMIAEEQRKLLENFNI